MSIWIRIFNKRIVFNCFSSPFGEVHGEVLVISGSNDVFTTRALGYDTEGKVEGIPWLHTAAYHSLVGNGIEEEVNKTGTCSYTPRKVKALCKSILKL